MNAQIGKLSLVPLLALFLSTGPGCDSSVYRGARAPNDSAPTSADDPVFSASGEPITSGLIIASDMGVPEGIVRIMDPTNGKIVYDYNTKNDASGVCAKPGTVCTPMGVAHTTHDGEDFIDMSIFVVGDFEAPDDGESFDPSYTFIQRIKPTNPPEVVWRIDSLSFGNAVNGSKYCRQSPENRCGKGVGTYCGFNWIHSIQVVYDNPDEKKVSLVLPDGFGPEILQVTLDYHGGNTCADVDWILGIKEDAWPWGPASSPNSAQLIQGEAGGPYLLVSNYSTVAKPYGASALGMWRWVNGNWALAWVFPEEIEGVQANLNTPHNAEFKVDPVTGERLILYAHSGATSTDWSEGDTIDHGGSWAMLRVGERLSDPPDYLLDAVIFPDDEKHKSHYPRDFDILDDGTWLLTDSACENEAGCQNLSRVFHTNPLDLPAVPPDVEGYFTPEGDHLNLVTIPEEDILEIHRCGFFVLFEAEWLPWDTLGRTLREAAAAPVADCPNY